MTRDDRAGKPVKDLADRIDAVMNGKGGWMRCPACSHDWTELRSCQWQRVEVRLCVCCAETCVALPWLAQKFPMGFEVILSPGKYVAGRQAIVKYGEGLVFRVWTDGVKLKARQEKTTNLAPTEFDNAVALYFGLRHAIEAGGSLDPTLTPWTQPGSNLSARGSSRRALPDRRSDQGHDGVVPGDRLL